MRRHLHLDAPVDADLDRKAVVLAGPPWHRHVARANLQSPRVCFFDSGALQIVRGLRQEEDRGPVEVRRAAGWLTRLAAQAERVRASPRCLRSQPVGARPL